MNSLVNSWFNTDDYVTFIYKLYLVIINAYNWLHQALHLNKMKSLLAKIKSTTCSRFFTTPWPDANNIVGLKVNYNNAVVF